MNQQSPYIFTYLFLRALSAGTAGVLFLSSCTTTPTKSTDELNAKVPMDWHQSLVSVQLVEDAGDLSQWWRQFKDPIMDQLIASALENNPTLRSVLLNVETARTQKGIASSALWPNVDAGVSGSGNRIDDLKQNSNTTGESYGANFSASWEVDLFRKQSDVIDSADADLRASEQDFHAAQVLLAAEVAETYLGFRSVQQEYAILTDSIDMREQTLQIIRWQEAAGEVNILEVQQAIVFLEQARTALPTLEQNMEEYLNALAVLCGDTPGSLHGLLKTSSVLPTLPAEIQCEFPAELLDQRPDIKAARLRIEAATANLSAAEKERLPSLTLFGSINLDEDRLGDLLDPTELVSNLVGSLTAPIWDAGRIGKQIELQDINLRQAYLSYESQVLTALSEVENALSSIVTSTRGITLAQTATDAARLSVEIAEQQFGAGEVDLLSVLESQRSQLSLEQSLINAHIKQLNGHIQLYRAMGGGWSVPQNK
ncbi:TolC family protein [Kiritimatiellota bacterium B12222]|nr:TolC family protein [Kiritimatiellota bacterium B12222]